MSKRSMKPQCVLFVSLLLCFSITAQNTLNPCDLFFSQNPVRFNSPNTFDSRVQTGDRYEDMDLILNKRLKSGKHSFDSGVSYVTNFKYQKVLSFRYQDTSKIAHLYPWVAYQIYQNSFFTPFTFGDLNYGIKKYNQDIYGLGNCLIYQLSLRDKEPSYQSSSQYVYLIFGNRPDVSRLPVRCLAIYADTIQWRATSPGNTPVVPVLTYRRFSGRGHPLGAMHVPVVYDQNTGRFIPIAHFVTNKE